MIFKAVFLCIISILLIAAARAEMKPLDDQNLGQVNAQNGISLSGSFDLNSSGGPLWDYNRDGNGDATTCTANDGKCGARFALQTTAGGGWAIFDDWRGGFSFGESDADPDARGLEVSVQTNTSASDDGTSKDVLEFKLPSKVNYNNVNLTIATGSSPSDNTLQTNILSLEINGPVVLQGKLLVFP